MTIVPDQDAASINRIERLSIGGIRLTCLAVALASIPFGFAPDKPHFAVVLLGLLSSCFAMGATWSERDPVRLFLLCHPVITYLGTTYAFALLNGNFQLDGFMDPDRAVSIVFVYQGAIIIAWLAASAVAPDRTSRSGDILLSAATSVAVISGSLALLALAVLANLASSLMPIWLSGLFLGIATFIERQPGGFWPMLAISVTVLLALSYHSNERTMLLLTLLFWFVAVVARYKGLLSFRGVAFALCAVVAVNAITFAFLTARIENDRGGTRDVAERTIELLFSYDALAYAAPLLPRKADSALDVYGRGSAYGSAFLRNAGSDEQNMSALGRLSLMAHMDIVTGRLPAEPEVDWDQLGSLVISALPDVGQKKSLIYSDQLVWGLGLRDRASVGRPLATVPGELFAMGGMGVLFLATLFMYAILFIQLSVFRSITGYTTAYVLIALSFIYGITMTGAAVGLAALVIRHVPVMILFVWLLRRFHHRRVQHA